MATASDNYSVIEIENPVAWLEGVEKKNEVSVRIIKNFIKQSRNNSDWLASNCVVNIVDASSFEPLCEPVEPHIMMEILMEAVHILTSGKMKITGKENNWSVGGFGSVWIDMNARKFGVTHIRIAFYAEETSGGDWKFGKPYHLGIMVEKVRKN